MRVFAMTAGIGGDRWRAWARRAAQSWERHTGVPCLVLYDVPSLCGRLNSPMWLKYWVWDFAPADADLVVWLDGDTEVLGALRLSQFNGFAAVEDA